MHDQKLCSNPQNFILHSSQDHKVSKSTKPGFEYFTQHEYDNIIASVKRYWADRQ